MEVTLPTSLTSKNLGKTFAKSYKAWHNLGVKKKNGQALPLEDTNVYLVKPAEKSPHVFLVTSNYDVLLKWNRSSYFATTVGLLASHVKNHNM